MWERELANSSRTQPYRSVMQLKYTTDYSTFSERRYLKTLQMKADTFGLGPRVRKVRVVGPLPWAGCTVAPTTQHPISLFTFGLWGHKRAKIREHKSLAA